jgi:hypothetical protein
MSRRTGSVGPLEVMSAPFGNSIDWTDRSGGLAGQDGQDAGDVVAELPHVVAQEFGGGVVGDGAVTGEELRGEPDVGLGGVI